MWNSHNQINTKRNNCISCFSHYCSKIASIPGQNSTGCSSYPSRILNERPVRVLINMSLPIKSVPNIYSGHGGRFFLEKSVINASSLHTYPNKVTVHKKASETISHTMVLTLRLFFHAPVPLFILGSMTP